MSILAAYREGVLPEDLDIIDVHGHLCGWPPFNTPPPDSKSMVWVMDSLGIGEVWLAAFEALTSGVDEGNRYTIGECARFPDRFRGYAVVNPNTQTNMSDQLRRTLSSREMIGVKMHPTIHKYPVTGSSYAPAWEVAHEMAVPVLVHTSGGNSLAGPSLLVDLAKRYDRAKIIIGHSGLTMNGIRESVEAARSASNLYLDTMGSRRQFRAVEYMAKEIGADRMVFGTDMYGHDAAAQLGKVVYARISDEEKRQILGYTARGFGV